MEGPRKPLHRNAEAAQQVSCLSCKRGKSPGEATLVDTVADRIGRESDWFTEAAKVETVAVSTRATKAPDFCLSYPILRHAAIAREYPPQQEAA